MMIDLPMMTTKINTATIPITIISWIVVMVMVIMKGANKSVTNKSDHNMFTHTHTRGGGNGKTQLVARSTPSDKHPMV